MKRALGWAAVLAAAVVVVALLGGCGGGGGASTVGVAAAAPQATGGTSQVAATGDTSADATASVASADASTAGGQVQPERVIVVFRQDFRSAVAQQALVARFGGQNLLSLPLVNGQSVLLPPQAKGALKARGEVLRIDPDAVVQALGKPTDNPGKGHNKPQPPPPSQPAQTVPWGIAAINAPAAWSSSTGAGVKVAVVDTGIDATHPDLSANVKGGVNFVSKSPARPANSDAWADDNGHGTHVSGTIAAVDNTIGVVGVAPQASLYAVKVLNKNGSGYVSWIIAGLDWCVTNHMQVVNMSLGASQDVQAFHDACNAAVAAHITLVAAAGNDGRNGVDYPAAYSSVISVGAVGQNEDGSLYRASFSNYGSGVDIAGPGVNVYSTIPGGEYAYYDGTSMATPHVTGTIALHPLADPAAVLTRLQATAQPLSGMNLGAGLVDAAAYRAGSS